MTTRYRIASGVLLGIIGIATIAGLNMRTNRDATDAIGANAISAPTAGVLALDQSNHSSDGGENSVPVLSKLPYISPLFKNANHDSETKSFKMVTPRIIISDEEEERLLGPGGVEP